MQTVQFRPDRTALAAVAVFFLGALYLALAGPLFTLLLLVPAACLGWTLRARVAAGDDGLEICNGLGRHRVPWEQVDAFVVRKFRPVLLRRTDGHTILLTALPRQDLPALLGAAQQ